MKNFFDKWRSYLTESSLSRLYGHMAEHDTAILTAFRGDLENTENCVDDSVDTKIPNKERNRDLKAFLLKRGYGVTAVNGSYIEDFNTPQAIEVSEDSLFVVNLKDSEEFFDTIVELGKKFCQDAVLLVPKGGKNARLVGTNSADFPGYGNSVSVGDSKFGGEDEFMTKIRNRPLTFNENLAKLETYKSLSRISKLAVSKIVESYEKKSV
jgi:hypothetical protein